MPLHRRVGGLPEGTGSEEAHRPPAVAAPAPGARYRRLVAGRRYRLQAAGLAVLAAVLLLSFAFPLRHVRITVDGGVRTVSSRANNDEAIVGQAGIELQPGDRVETTGDDELTVRRATEATLQVDGEVLSLRSQAATIEQLLTEAHVPLAPDDSVLRNDTFVAPNAPVAAPSAVASRGTSGGPPAPSQGPVALEVRRAVPFSVVENGQPLELRSSRETVATALRDVGVRLGPGDEVQPALDTELTAGLQVHVDHATQVVVTLPEGKTILYTLAATAGEAIAESEIALPADYRLEPSADALVAAGMAIRVVAISQESVLETERIASETVYEPDASLPWGERRVVQGQDGVHYRQYRVVYENDAAISHELVDEWYDPEPQNTVIYYSTADPPPPPGDLPDGVIPTGVLRVYATWYNPASAGRSPSDPSYGITATGVPVDRGIVAVDPSVIPLGTRIYVPGYGYAVAADTGGGIRGAMIDLGYPDGVVPNWISHWVDIYILGP